MGNADTPRNISAGVPGSPDAKGNADAPDPRAHLASQASTRVACCRVVDDVWCRPQQGVRLIGQRRAAPPRPQEHARPPASWLSNPSRNTPMPHAPRHAANSHQRSAVSSQSDDHHAGQAPVDRRTFVGRSIAAGATIILGTGTACTTPARDTGDSTRASDTASRPGPVPASGVPARDALFEQSVANLRAAMERGALTSRALVDRYLTRIDAMDKRGPAVNAVIELNPDARTIAYALDAERKAGHVRGPLHGIPILIKDNIDSADRMRTSAGSLALATSTPPRDAFIVERLRAADPSLPCCHHPQGEPRASSLVVLASSYLAYAPGDQRLDEISAFLHRIQDSTRSSTPVGTNTITLRATASDSDRGVRCRHLIHARHMRHVYRIPLISDQTILRFAMSAAPFGPLCRTRSHPYQPPVCVEWQSVHLEGPVLHR